MSHSQIKTLKLHPGENVLEARLTNAIFGFFEVDRPGRKTGELYMTYVENPEERVRKRRLYVALNQETIEDKWATIDVTPLKGGGFATLLAHKSIPIRETRPYVRKKTNSEPRPDAPASEGVPPPAEDAHSGGDDSPAAVSAGVEGS